jgi:hypothetical protein
VKRLRQIATESKLGLDSPTKYKTLCLALVPIKYKIHHFNWQTKLIENNNNINYFEKVMPKELQQTFQSFCCLQRFVR